MKTNKYFLSFTIVLLFNLNSFANPKPIVDFQQGFAPPERCWGPINHINENPIPNCFGPESFGIPRFFDKTKTALLKRYIERSSDEEKPSEKNINGFSLLTFNKQDDVTYILKNNVNVGYYLIGLADATDFDSSTFVDNSIKEMKKLKKVNYLNEEIKNSNLKLSFYKRDVGDFVELYCFVDGVLNPELGYKRNLNQKRNYFILDAFYPKVLESHLKKNLNIYLEIFFKKVNPNHDGKDKSKDKNSGSRDNDKKIGK